MLVFKTPEVLFDSIGPAFRMIGAEQRVEFRQRIACEVRLGRRAYGIDHRFERWRQSLIVVVHNILLRPVVAVASADAARHAPTRP